jgi:hypothetical protein
MAIRLEVPQQDMKRHPQIQEAQFTNQAFVYLAEMLNKTQRFTIIGERLEAWRATAETWELTPRGVYGRTMQHPSLRMPEFVAYAELFDLVKCAPHQVVLPWRKTVCCVTGMGVQVQVWDRSGVVKALGTTNPESPEGKYIHHTTLPIWAPPGEISGEWAMSIAMRRAVRHAVLEAMRDYDARNKH